MPDFNIHSDSVNVEQIMEQIRARIREKRGVDYTEQQIRELAAVKLEKFLDPRGVRSDLLDEFRRAQAPIALPNYAFEASTIYETHRGPIQWIRRLLNPILKLFFNPNPLIRALHIQAELNTLHAEQLSRQRAVDALHFEVIHNLVMEITRLGIETKNLKMRVESLVSRLEFNERRARALESVVVYKPAGERETFPEPPTPGPAPAPPAGAPAPAGIPEGPGQRSRRRRRRRGRRGHGSAAAVMSGSGPGPSNQPAPTHPGSDPKFGSDPNESAQPSPQASPNPPDPDR